MLSKEADGFLQRGSRCVGQSGGLPGSGLLRVGISFDEDGRDAEGTGGLDVGERVADDEAVGAGGLREIAEGLQEHPGLRLAAAALVFVVRAVVKSVDVSAMEDQMLLHLCVERLNVGGGVFPQGNAALVADDEDAAAGAVEGGDGGDGAGKEVEIAPVADVGAFGRLAVDDAVAVEKDKLHVLQGKRHRWKSVHER